MLFLNLYSPFSGSAGHQQTGYAHPSYAHSLREYGRPRQLRHCGGWVLERDIPGTRFRDAMGCYPLFACRDWARLHEDLEELAHELVSLTLVPDPLAGASPDSLRTQFGLVRPFKTHYVADLRQPLEQFVGRSHRKNSRKALERIAVEVCRQPARYDAEWTALYSGLISRHGISGISAFSERAFQAQLAMPGMLMFLARHEGAPVGASLVLLSGEHAYFHLTACTDEGYRLRAAYALHWKALEFGQEQELRYFHLGGAAGLNEEPGDGLAEFKRGWSNEQRTAYLCGRIFDSETYESLSRDNGTRNAIFFPAYRARGLRAAGAGRVLPACVREEWYDEGEY